MKSWLRRPLGAVIVAVAVGLGGGGIIAATTGGGGGGGGVTCNLNATVANFASQVSASSNGQTICLTESSDYGAWTGTNKSITITPADGVSPTMSLNLASGDTGFTIDGRRDTWNDTTGMHINGGEIDPGVTNITIRDFWSTDPGNTSRLWVMDPGPTIGSNITIDHGHFYEVGNDPDTSEAIFYIEPTATGSGDTGFVLKNSLFRDSGADGVKFGGSDDDIITVKNNKFLNIQECVNACVANHTDAIQGFEGAGAHFIGNWIDQTSQNLSSFDEGGNMTIKHNLITNSIGFHWISLYGDNPGSTVEHNTIADATGAIICYGKVGHPASLTTLRNNVAREIALTDPGVPTCTPTANTNNMLDSGATGGNFNGTPDFVGTAEYDDYCLEDGSVGEDDATDGSQVGICGGAYSESTYGPPEGEGY